jgi:riboflavin kinase/FMN adenylyltransferase
VKVVRGLDSAELKLNGSVLTIGNFDGVHRGHQQLLAQGGLLAADARRPLAVLTFEPHPLAVVAPSEVPARLTTLQEKLSLLAAGGADVTVVAESTPRLLGLEAESFVRDIIVGKFRPSHVVEGPSFGFGHKRRGSVEMLRRLGHECGFETCVVGPIELQVEPNESALVSSTLIRQLIRQGKVHRAALCLGRPYALTGEVVAGHHRGKDLGFPTANIRVEDVLAPPDGVYSGLARGESLTAPAAISIGTAPTFGEGPRRIEAYLLDVDSDLYGATLRLEFLRWLRPQRTYESAEDLVVQMKADVAEVRAHAHDAEGGGADGGSLGTEASRRAGTGSGTREREKGVEA